MQIILIFACVWGAMIANGVWEASVEGRKPWDKGKTGWKLQMGKYVLLTRYHFWLFGVMWPLLLLLPFALFGFDSRLFGMLLSAFFTGLILEDITWFIANPFFGLRRFNPREVHWYPWLSLGPVSVPALYVVAALAGLTSWHFLWS